MHWKVWGRVFGGDGYIYAWDLGLNGIDGGSFDSFGHN